MKIKKMTADFGTLDQKTLELDGGLNIIQGENESGKSTWCAFIRAMLYGIDSSQRDTKQQIAEKNKFRPWRGSSMSGVMELESGGQSIVIERRSAPNAPMRDLSVRTAAGEDYSFSEPTPGEHFTGCEKETFEKSAFISRPELPAGGNELEKRILSLVSTGDDRYSFQNAETRLKERINKLKYNKTGEIPELERRIEELDRIIRENSENEAELLRLRESAADLREEKASLERELEAHRQSGIAERERRLEAARADRESAAGELEQIRAGLPESDAFELRGLLADLGCMKGEEHTQNRGRAEQLEHELARQRAQIAETMPFKGCSSESAAAMVESDIAVLRGAGGQPAPVRIISFAALAAATLLFVLSFWFFDAYVTYISLAAMFIAGVYILVSFMAGRLKRDTVFARYSCNNVAEITKSLEDYRGLLAGADELEASLAGLRGTLRAAEDRYGAALARADKMFALGGDEARLTKAVQTAIDKFQKFDEAKARLDTAEAVLKAVDTGTGEKPGSGEVIKPTMPLDTVNARYTVVTESLSSQIKQQSYLEGVLDQNEAAGAKYERETLSARLDSAGGQLAALSLALEVLREANSSLRERFSPSLNERAAAIFAAFTGDKYDRVVISREFTAMAGSSDSTGLRRSLEYSRGTSDQLWLAVRIAICDVVLNSGADDGGKMAPIILDDALLTFDDTRLGNVLDYLYKLSAGRQIILFTCQQREAEYFRDRDVNIVSI